MSSPSGLPPEVLARIRIVFFQECDDLLAELESGLLALQRGERDPEIVNSVFRAVHSIKGSAGIFGFDALAGFAHLFETAMEEFRSGRQTPEPESLKALLCASDVLADHVRAARDGGEGPADAARSAEDALTEMIGARLGDPLTETDLDFTPLPAVLQTSHIDEVAEAPALIPPAEEPRQPPGRSRTETLRVDLDRVDRLADLAGEIVITHAMLLQRVSEAGLAGETPVGMALEDLNTLTRDLRDSVMAIRAQSVKSVFQRMSRLVRELEAVTGKQVDLTLSGEATEVDRTVIERLTDPLTHMVRNAIDHGLEPPEQRLAAGKPSRGALRISAAHRAGRIVIEICDDGAGVDRARVKAIAIERELIAPDALISDDEADNLIFLPGFSTARSISDLSGRGVGLDVVKQNVQAMGGRVSLSSHPGAGSTFTLSLPLTLAVLDGMVVNVRGQSVVVPVGVLLESVQPRPGDVRHIGSAALLAYRGEQVPLLDLGAALAFGEGPIDLARRVALLVEDGAGRRAALLVDEILDQRQVVIKSLEANYGRVDGVAAATILGDGRVALILDVDAVIAAHGRQSQFAQRLAATG